MGSAGVYPKKLQGGLKAWPGVQIMFSATRITWSNRTTPASKCGGFNANDFCVKLDDPFQKYQASSDLGLNASSLRSKINPGDPGRIL